MRGQLASRLAGHARHFSSSTPESPLFLVYGATGGVGSELCARLLAREDARVVLAGRDAAKLDSTAAALPDPSRASTHVVDILDLAAVDALTTAVTKEHGPLAGVANCVGSVVLKSAHATTPEEFEDVLRTNLFSSFNVLKSSVKSMMRTGGGSLVFCSSAVARHGLANHEAIAAAKGGIAAMALSAAATYAPKNIRINCVAPGLPRTPMTERITASEAALKASVAMHALRRIGEPGDVAAALEFLLAPENSFITGQVLSVDGGLSSLRPS